MVHRPQQSQQRHQYHIEPKEKTAVEAARSLALFVIAEWFIHSDVS